MKRSLKTKLRIRFILMAMLSLFLIQSLIVGVSIFNNYLDLVKKSDMLISQLHNNPTVAVRYFSVKIPQGKDTAYPDVVQHVSITAENAASLTQRALAMKRTNGFLEGYRFRIYQNENGTKIYFLLRESSIEMFWTAAENLMWVSFAGLIVIGVLLIPLSGWVVQPIVENHRKQKVFITSAGHSLKTPLTVISANAQLLESEIGSSQWLEGIQKQVGHLTQMTQDLLTLSRTDEYENPLVRDSFSLSDVFEDMLEAYRVIAKQKGIQLDYLPQENLTYSGSEAEVQQLIQILLDNACKYCLEDGYIRITTKRNFHGVHISVANTARLQRDEKTDLLQRFQRGQNAAGIPGFGLGLSIAKAIADRHNGALTISNTADTFRVEVVLR